MSILSHLNTSLVSVNWLNENRKASNLIILDASINKVIDKNAVRIPNARFFDIKKKFSDISAPFPSTLPTAKQFQEEARNLGINTNSLLIIYDNKGIYSSPRAWWLFKTYGFENVAVLNGGLPEWKKLNFSVDNYSNEIYSIGNFEAKLHLHFMTNFKGITEYSQNSDALIMDARSKERFKCLINEPRAGLRRGTIPNSINLPYAEVLNGNTFKSKLELSQIFKTIVKDNNHLVFSCGSGITACILALAASICDYGNLVVYDGSWTEYGSLTN